MEQSQSNGGVEECHSSESGWTMYIGSNIDDYDEEDDGVENGRRIPQADVEDDDESDDSMASDASSGPSHHYGNPWENIEVGGYNAMAEEHQEHDNRLFLEKKENNRTRGKQIAGRKEEDEDGTVGDKATPDQDDDKVRRNFRMGKRK